MSYDLNGGLRDLSGDPVTDRDLPLTAILGRLHRARRVRTASYSAVGVAAVAAVAIAIAAVGADRAPDPLPPVDSPSPTQTGDPRTPTPTSTPTPTPTPTPTTTPTEGPDWSSPSSWDCGSTVDLFTPLLDAGPAYSFVLTNRNLEYGPQVTDDPAAPFRLTIGIVRYSTSQEVASARIVDVLAGHGESGEFTIDGVLARRPRQVADPVSPMLEAFGVAADVQLVSCDGSPLDGDTYRIAATVEVTRADGSVVTMTVPFWAYIGAEPTGEPVRYPPPQHSGDRAQVVSTARPGAAGLPTCGETYSRGPTAGAGLSLSGSSLFGGGVIQAAVTLAHAGLDISDGLVVGPFLTVTQNGVVVGQTQDLPYTALALKNWLLGDAISINSILGDSACEPMDAALPAGDYEVWAMVTVWTEPDVNGAPQFFYGGPWPVTIP